MKYEKNDVHELYKRIGIKANNYIEIKENEAVIKIQRKWPLVEQIISFCKTPLENRQQGRI